MQSEICKIPDYKTMMRRAAIGLDGYGMSYVRSVLKSKMKANTDRQHTRLECLFEALSEYVTGDQHAFVYALTHKAPYRNNKLQWIGRPVDAALFVDVFFDGSFAAFMKCFELKGGRKVRASDRPEGTKDKYPICDIIKLYTK